MESIRSFLKNYVIFLLVLQLLSYLTPKESYRQYVRFFTGALMAVLLLRPVLGWMGSADALPEALGWDEVMEQLAQIEYEGEGESMFEIFFVEDGTE